MHTQDRIFWVDFVRAVAILLVVVLHSSADLFYEFMNIPMQEWWTANVYDSISHICVPLFVMISGYTLLGKNERLSRFIVRRLGKLILVIVVWSIIFIGYKSLFENIHTDIMGFVLAIFQGPVYFHLWFLYTLLGLYLILPVLRSFAQHASQNAQWYFIGIWLFALIGVPSLEFFIGKTPGISFVQFSGFVGYLLLGYMLGKIPRNNRLTAAMIPIAIISPAATMIRTYIASESIGAVNETFYSYLSPNVIFASIASFWLLRLLGEAVELRLSSRSKEVLTSLSQASLGIYLIHPLVMKLLAFKAGISPYMGNPLWSIPLIALITTVISFGIIWVLKKIPGSKWVM